MTPLIVTLGKWIGTLVTLLTLSGCSESFYVSRGWETNVCGREDIAGIDNTLMFERILTLIREYDQKYGSLPAVNYEDGPDGISHNWRCELIRDYFLSASHSPRQQSKPGECDALIQISRNRPWRSTEVADANARLHIKYRQIPFEGTSPPTCQVLAVTGRGTAFELNVTHKYESLDGDTILLVESVGSGAALCEPQNAHLVEQLVDIMGAADGISSEHPFGFLVGFRDGTVWRLSSSVPPEDLQKFMDIDAARKYDREDVLRQWKYDLGAKVVSELAPLSK